jgi:thymidylate synthase
VNEFQYQPHYKPNQLICGSGQVAIVTGWTVKESVAKALLASEYAVIGQLYSPTRGISFLLRNLFANPHVHTLVVLNATREDRNAGACRCLLDFFQQGFDVGTSDTGRDCWIISSSVTGFIDLEIPANALESLRRSLTVIEATSIRDAIAQTKQLSQTPSLAPTGEPLFFPLAEPSTDQLTLPGTRYGHRIEGPTIAQTWVKILHRIRTTGTARPTAYDGQWQELIDLMAIVTDEPPEIEFPEPNYLPCDRTFIQDYISQILEDALPQEGVKYTYGQRLRSWFGRDQIQQVIDHLSANPDSARAVMSLWDVRDYEAGNSPPCLNHVWVRISDGALSLTATFRSNDMFSAWPANAIGLRVLQAEIRDAMVKDRSKSIAASGAPLTLGPLITISQSAHIYDDCWDNADQVIRTHYPRICQTRDFADPAGSFVITVGQGEIQVEQMTPGSGEVVACYGGKSAKQLYQHIAQASPGLEVEHALYLGTELQKAELALQHPQVNYQQDKPLQI